MQIRSFKITTRDVIGSLSTAVIVLGSAIGFWLNQTYARPDFVKNEDDKVVAELSQVIKQKTEGLADVPQRVNGIENSIAHFSAFAIKHEREEAKTMEMLSDLRVAVGTIKAHQDDDEVTRREIIDLMRRIESDLAKQQSK